MDEYGAQRRICGYTLLRKIGEGGFGSVHLARRDGVEGFVALKLIESENAERERRAIEKYATLPDRANLVEILDYGVADGAAFFAMPLADALETPHAFSPTDFRWQEKSLWNLIEQRREHPVAPWFSGEEIAEIIAPVFDAAIALGERGLLHRDIKPANVLFFGGRAKLADFSLLERDRRSLSRLGTPLFAAPSWFLDSGGNPDAYGLAATLYTLATGNLPDAIGRAAFLFPEGAEEKFSDEERERRLHLHRCILRAIAENPADRFVTLADFRNAALSDDFESSRTFRTTAEKTARRRFFRAGALASAVAAALGAGAVLAGTRIYYSLAYPSYEPPAVADALFGKISAEGLRDEERGVYIDDREAWRKGRREFLEGLKKDFARDLALARLSEEEIRAREPDRQNLHYEVKIARERLANLSGTIARTERELADDSAYRAYVAEKLAQAKKLAAEP
ncbi:MAG: hypothetical protein ACI4QA_03865 [Candidatus Spyradosoma sp.]